MFCQGIVKIAYPQHRLVSEITLCSTGPAAMRLALKEACSALMNGNVVVTSAGEEREDLGSRNNVFHHLTYSQSSGETFPRVK